MDLQGQVGATSDGFRSAASHEGKLHVHSGPLSPAFVTVAMPATRLGLPTGAGLPPSFPNDGPSGWQTNSPSERLLIMQLNEQFSRRDGAAARGHGQSLDIQQHLRDRHRAGDASATGGQDVTLIHPSPPAGASCLRVDTAVPFAAAPNRRDVRGATRSGPRESNSRSGSATSLGAWLTATRQAQQAAAVTTGTAPQAGPQSTTQPGTPRLSEPAGGTLADFMEWNTQPVSIAPPIRSADGTELGGVDRGATGSGKCQQDAAVMGMGALTVPMVAGSPFCCISTSSVMPAFAQPMAETQARGGLSLHPLACNDDHQAAISQQVQCGVVGASLHRGTKTEGRGDARMRGAMASLPGTASGNLGMEHRDKSFSKRLHHRANTGCGSAGNTPSCNSAARRQEPVAVSGSLPIAAASSTAPGAAASPDWRSLVQSRASGSIRVLPLPATSGVSQAVWEAAGLMCSKGSSEGLVVRTACGILVDRLLADEGMPALLAEDPELFDLLLAYLSLGLHPSMPGVNGTHGGSELLRTRIRQVLSLIDDRLEALRRGMECAAAGLELDRPVAGRRMPDGASGPLLGIHWGASGTQEQNVEVVRRSDMAGSTGVDLNERW